MQDCRTCFVLHPCWSAAQRRPVAFGVPRQCGKACRGNRAVSDTKSARKPPYRVSLTSENGFNANHGRDGANRGVSGEPAHAVGEPSHRARVDQTSVYDHIDVDAGFCKERVRPSVLCAATEGRGGTPRRTTAVAFQSTELVRSASLSLRHCPTSDLLSAPREHGRAVAATHHVAQVGIAHSSPRVWCCCGWRQHRKHGEGRDGFQ